MGGASAATALAHLSAEAEVDQEAEAQAGPFSTHRLGLDQTLAGSPQVPSMLHGRLLACSELALPPANSMPWKHPQHQCCTLL